MCLLVSRRKQEEVASLETKIRQQSEQQKKAGVELDATCHICLKTKFADGVGHICHYCKIRCCARCGGKVTLRSNKVSLAICAFSHLECRVTILKVSTTTCSLFLPWLSPSSHFPCFVRWVIKDQDMLIYGGYEPCYQKGPVMICQAVGRCRTLFLVCESPKESSINWSISYFGAK